MKSSLPRRAARDLEYVVTKTVLRSHEYGHAAEPIVEALGFSHDDYERAGGLGVIRCTVMDPFFAARRGKEDFIAGFARTLRKVLEQVL
jgi:hypothetical protein